MKSQSVSRASSEARTDVGATKMMIGPSQEGPKKCLHCHQPFLVGETWLRMTSPSDPEYGSYTVGIHLRCHEAVVKAN
jgi:hypothetical protein